MIAGSTPRWHADDTSYARGLRGTLEAGGFVPAGDGMTIKPIAIGTQGGLLVGCLASETITFASNSYWPYTAVVVSTVLGLVMDCLFAIRK